MKKIITILVVLFIFSCKKGSDTKPSLQSYNRYGNVDPKNKKMGYEAINTVDTLLYNKVSSMYSLSRNREELFFFANMMALKHNYQHAYYDLYFLTRHIDDEKDIIIYNYSLYNISKYYELKRPSYLYHIVGDDTITKDNIKASSFYLDKLKE